MIRQVEVSFRPSTSTSVSLNCVCLKKIAYKTCLLFMIKTLMCADRRAIKHFHFVEFFVLPSATWWVGFPHSSSQNDNDPVSPELPHTTDQDPVPCWALVHGHWSNHPDEPFPNRGLGVPNTLARSVHLSQSIRLNGSSPKRWPLTFHNRENRGELSDPSFSFSAD